MQVNKYFQPKSSIIMNNELAINEQSNLIASVQTVMKTAPEVLNANKLSVQNAVKASHAMLDTIEASGMNDEIDEAVNNLQVKLKKTQAKINEARTPITQMLTLISKEFTTLEKPLDPNNKEGVYYLLQQHRNAFAQTKAINQRKKQEEADRKMRIAQERIDIRAKIKSAAMATFSEHLLSKKMELQALMDALTLQNWTSGVNEMQEFSDVYDYNRLIFGEEKVNFSLLNEIEFKEINREVRLELKKEFVALFKEGINSVKERLRDELQSKKAELEEYEKAGEIEKARIAQEQKVRAEEQERKTKEEEAARIAAQQAAIDSEKEVEATNALFDNQMEIGFESKSNARQGYEIQVNHALGWVAIFQFWMQKEGVQTPLDKFETKKLGSMKTFCENYAHKHNEKIDSKFLKYVETFKAIAKA